jgi:hypothetical protein
MAFSRFSQQKTAGFGYFYDELDKESAPIIAAITIFGNFD